MILDANLTLVNGEVFNTSYSNGMMQDEYFQVDNSAIKHDGFFVNRGKLERV